MITFYPGLRVIWTHERGGWGWVFHTPATVVKATPKRVVIDVELKDGSTVRRTVKPEKLERMPIRKDDPFVPANWALVIAAVAADQCLTAQIRITDTGRTVEVICADTGELLAQPRMYGKAESYPAIKQFWAWQRMLGKGGKSEGGGYSASFSMDVGEYFSRRAWWDRMDAQ